MARSVKKGSEILCSVLEDLGLQVVFGIPGSQSIGFFEALRRSSLRTILAVDERAAAFMANGYYRASGRVAVVATIGGPGFTNALTGLAEARHDSAGLLCLVMANHRFLEKKFRLQALDLQTLTAPVVKKFYQVTTIKDLSQTVHRAYAEAITGEPGPVVIEITDSILTESGEIPPRVPPPLEAAADLAPPDEQIAAVAELLSGAGRIVLYAGQGAAGAAETVRRLAESLGSPVLTTCSGRGILPENHPLSFYFDYSWGRGGETVNHFIAQSDLVLALGCKFTHNGTGGFRLKISADKLIHVDASREVLGANYPARLTVQGDVPAFLSRITERSEVFADRPEGWTEKELGVFRSRLAAEKEKIAGSEPVLAGETPVDCTDFFTALREALPDGACVVTDSGLHQVLTRNHFEVRCPRGMIVPTDFQSMAFGIPAAIGAQLAVPERPVVAIIGDGGFAMTAMELSTAVREKIPLTVIVFADRSLGLVRLQQFEHSGHEHAVGLGNQDYSDLARSLGMAYARWDEVLGREAGEMSFDSDVRLIEVPLKDSPAIRRTRLSGRVYGAARDLFGPRLISRLKKLLGR